MNDPVRAHASRAPMILSLLMIVGISTMVTLGVGELYVRHAERTRADFPGTLPLMYYRHEQLGRALVRSSDNFGWARINSHGFRGPEHSAKKPPGTVRIMAVGSSTTFETCVRDADAWPARLQALMVLGNPGVHIEVINAGVPGYQMQHQISRVQADLRGFEPDAILLYEGHNDLARSLHEATTTDRGSGEMRPRRLPAITPWTNWLTNNSLLYNKVLLRLRALRDGSSGSAMRTPLSDSAWTAALEDAENAYRREVRSFLLVASGLDIPVIVVGLSHMNGDGDVTDMPAREREIWSSAFASPPEVTLDGYRRFARVAQEEAKALRAPFIATTPFGIVSPAFYCDGDPIHFNEAGAKRMSEGLAAVIDEKREELEVDGSSPSRATPKR